MSGAGASYPWASDPIGYLRAKTGLNVVPTGPSVRLPAHNAQVPGASPTSEHQPGFGFASDTAVPGMSMSDYANAVAASGIPFDQMINEGNHLHVGFKPNPAMDRTQSFAMNGGATPPQVMNSSPSGPSSSGDPTDAIFASALAQHGASGDPVDAMFDAAVTARAHPSSPPKPSKPGPPPPEPVSLGGDIFRSGATGLAQGIAGFGGMAGDIRSGLAHRFLPQGVADTVDTVAGALPPILGGGPTSTQLNQNIQDLTGGYHVPQTESGRIAQTAASFVPALAGGPESMGARLLTRVGLPTAGATVGRNTDQLLGGSGQTGELVGTLAGALTPVGARAAAAAVGSRLTSLVPSIGDLKAAANNAYDVVDKSGMMISAPAMQGLVNDIRTKLTNFGITPENEPKAFGALGTLDAAAANNQTLKGLSILRRTANNAIGAAQNDSDRMMGHTIVDHIDDFAENLNPSQTVGPVDSKAITALSDARDYWSRYRQASTIQDAIDKAGIKAGRQVGNLPALNQGNQLRNVFGQMAENPRVMSRFSPDLRQAIIKVSNGGPVENALRLLGKLSPDQLIPAMGEMASLGLLHNPALLAAPVAGIAGKLGSAAIAARNARIALALARAGKGGITQAPMLPALLKANKPLQFAPVAMGAALANQGSQ